MLPHFCYGFYIHITYRNLVVKTSPSQMEPTCTVRYSNFFRYTIQPLLFIIVSEQ